MSIIIATNALKHSLSAAQAANSIARGLRRSGVTTDLVLMPVADGGDGTLDAFLARGGDRVEVMVRDPLERPIRAAFGMVGDTAIIEMARASGLALLTDAERDPLRATTYGTGELIGAALDAGARRIIIGLGGSATVDGGAGCLQALGLRLLDANGKPIPVGGGGLAALAQIDTSAFDPRLLTVEIVIASDVDNPTLGERGAAAVFAPQKGASPEQVVQLEDNLRHFFTLAADHGVDVRAAPGGGAAGAFAAGLLAFTNARLQSGIDLILDHHDFDTVAQTAELVITSEGRMDEQTVYGKAPIGIARRAANVGVKTVALVGGLAANDALLHEAGLWAVLPIVDAPMPLEQAIRDADALMERAALRLGYLLQLR